MAIHRRRTSTDGSGLIVNPWVFRIGDGTWSFFRTDPVYPDVVTAERAWGHIRRDVWAATHYTKIPRAAEAYDGLTCDGVARLRFTCLHTDFPAGEVLAALADDRAAVAAFRRNDPRGAGPIGDFLDLWLAYLEHLEDVTRRIAADVNRWQGGHQMTHGVQRTYESLVANDNKDTDDAR